MLKRKLSIITLVILLVILSIVRENTFEAINAFINGKPSFLEHILTTQSPEFWSKFKWLLIIFSFTLFMGITRQLIHKIFKNKLYTKLTIYAFIALLGVSAVFILIGFMINNFKFGYTIARYIMDFTQTPALFLILFATFKVFDKQ